MNFIVATSRGKGLLALNGHPNTVLRFHSGASIADLTDVAKDLIEDHPQDPLGDRHFVYFVAGLPDVTLLQKRKFNMHHRSYLYQEVVFKEEPSEAFHRVKELYEHADAQIKISNAIPVFSTIAPSSLHTWNSLRLYQQKTTHLLHFKHYSKMQDNLITTILQLNTFIRKLNQQNGVATPQLAKEIIYRRGNSTRVRYGKLDDGVHPSPKIQEAWTNTLKSVLDLNRGKMDLVTATLPHNPPCYNSADNTSSSDEDQEPKRSWKY